MKGTKGTKRTLSMLTACTLSVAMLGLMPVSAQEAPALESNVSAQAQMPEAFDATQDALELLEQTIATLSSPELQQCERQDLCSTFGVSDLSELTYSAPYYWYNFYSQERVEGEGMTYVILVYRDGAYCGYLHVTPAYGLIQKASGTNTGIETALENHAEMWFGSATVDGLPCHLLYADGVIYNYDRDVATDLVWGDIPYSEYNSGMVIEKPGTAGAFSTEENNQIAQKAIADYFEWSGKGLTSYEDYTYSPAYTVSNFLTGETLDDWVNVIVKKDGVAVGYFSAWLEEHEPYTQVYYWEYPENVSTDLTNALKYGDAFHFESSCGYFVNGSLRDMLYLNGKTYDMQRGDVFDGAPNAQTYVKMGGLDEPAETPDEPVVTTTTEPTADESVQLLGDVDLDGRLTLIDVVYLSKAANDSLVLNDAQRQNADCNADGELNAQDAVSLLRFLVHTADSLPN